MAGGTQVQAGRHLLADDPAGAMDVLMQARADDPANPQVAAAIAEPQAAQGDLEAAEAQENPEIARLRGRMFNERIATAPRACAARVRIAVHQVRAGDVEGTMESQLQVLRQDRKYGGDAARHPLLSLHQTLCDDPAVGSIGSACSPLPTKLTGRLCH